MTLRRRQFIKHGVNLGIGAGIAGSLSGVSPAVAQSAQNLIMKTIPSSGEQIPGVGIGCNQYQGGPDAAEMPTFKATFATFHRLGGRVVDTSPNYSNSEEVVGRLMAELNIRQDMWVATKVDRQEKQAGIERMEGSFRRLGGDKLDLMQVHNVRGAEVQLETMKAWKEAGRLKYIGVTTSRDSQYDDLLAIMQKYTLDFIQVDFSLGNRNAGNRLLPLAADKGMAVLVNLPFGRGRLFRAVGDRPLTDWAQALGAKSWAQVFLKYIMAQPGTVIPIPGTTKPHHAEDNVGAATGKLPDENLMREMERFIDPLLG